MTNWYKNARPISLPQSMLPALTAVALSYGQSSFSWIAAIASVLGVALLHLGLNLLDDWFDYRSGSAEARQKVTSGFGSPGSMVAKSRMNSLCEWVMIARLEYEPLAISCLSSMLKSFSFDIIFICFSFKYQKQN